VDHCADFPSASGGLTDQKVTALTDRLIPVGAFHLVAQVFNALIQGDVTKTKKNAMSGTPAQHSDIGAPAMTAVQRVTVRPLRPQKPRQSAAGAVMASNSNTVPNGAIGMPNACPGSGSTSAMTGRKRFLAVSASKNSEIVPWLSPFAGVCIAGL